MGRSGASGQSKESTPKTETKEQTRKGTNQDSLWISKNKNKASFYFKLSSDESNNVIHVQVQVDEALKSI